jgi:hypothetical protein
VLELVARSYAVQGCFGDKAPLDALEEHAAIPVRVASDELLLLGQESARTVPSENDSGLLRVDLSSAFATFAVTGDARFEAFSRLSAFRLPSEGVALGLVADVPAKVIVRTDEILLVVSSLMFRHVRERVLSSCLDLLPNYDEESVEFLEVEAS